jgi:hypothetical protein
MGFDLDIVCGFGYGFFLFSFLLYLLYSSISGDKSCTEESLSVNIHVESDISTEFSIGCVISKDGRKEELNCVKLIVLKDGNSCFFFFFYDIDWNGLFGGSRL